MLRLTLEVLSLNLNLQLLKLVMRYLKLDDNVEQYMAALGVVYFELKLYR
jgi:hypothetical protein